LYATSATISGTIVSGSGSSYTGNAIDQGYIGDLNANKITAGNIATDRLTANVLTALQANVSTLSAITANIGTITAGTITGVSITANNGELVCKGSTALVFKTDGGDTRGYIGAYGSSVAITSNGSYISFWGRQVLNIDKLSFSNSAQSIVINGDNELLIKFYENCGFVKNGSVSCVIDENIWTQGTLYADGGGWFDDSIDMNGNNINGVGDINYACTVYTGKEKTAKILNSVMGKGVGNKDWSEMDHTKIHPSIKATWSDSKTKKLREGYCINKLIMVQNKMLLELSSRMEALEKKVLV
jgi:hypothetical protein